MTLRTVGQALREGRTALQTASESPGMDVQLLLSHILSHPREWVLAHPEHFLQIEQSQRIENHIQQLADGLPLAYVLGWWEFYGRRFKVSPVVLIPRPDTECLVELGLEFLSKYNRPALTLDLGTGSGCIGITFAAERTQDHVIAVDISPNALDTAVVNAREHGVAARIDYVRADGLSAFSGKVALVCANLPYIASNTLTGLDVSRYEPLTALDGGEDGFDFIRSALARLPNVLEDSGCGIFEIAADQGGLALQEAGRILPEWISEIHTDLAGRDRILSVRGSK